MVEESLDSVAASRAHLYRFLSAVLADPPDAEAIDTLAGPGLLDELSLSNSATQHALDGLTDWAATVTDPDEEAEMLAREHTRLFVGPRPVLQIHESYYADDYLGEPLARVKGTYTGLDIAPAADLREEPDHAAVELAALSLLFERDDDEQVTLFLREHGWWMPELAADIETHADSGFYRAVAGLLDALISQDASRLDVSLES